jgi:hypothetical protein
MIKHMLQGVVWLNISVEFEIGWNRMCSINWRR